MTVKDADAWGPSAVLVNKTINNSSEPWVLVNVSSSGASSSILNFNIKFEFTEQPAAGSTATLKMHI